MVCIPLQVLERLSDDEVLQLLNQQGYARIHGRQGHPTGSGNKQVVGIGQLQHEQQLFRVGSIS